MLAHEMDYVAKQKVTRIFKIKLHVKVYLNLIFLVMSNWADHLMSLSLINFDQMMTNFLCLIIAHSLDVATGFLVFTTPFSKKCNRKISNLY